jgi:uncharacterized protein YndB with AHSA1/START domain
MSAVPKKPAVVAKVTTPTDREIRTERVFDAPRERVWRAFTDPKLVAQWWGRATSSSSSGWKPNAEGAGGTWSTPRTAFTVSRDSSAR